MVRKGVVWVQVRENATDRHDQRHSPVNFVVVALLDRAHHVIVTWKVFPNDVTDAPGHDRVAS